MHPCERVDLSFIENAPYRFRNSIDLAITPEQLFEVFADAESWPRFVTLIGRVTWTSPQPHGVGTTRTAEIAWRHRRQRRVPGLGTVHPHGLSVQRMLSASLRRIG